MTQNVALVSNSDVLIGGIRLSNRSEVLHSAHKGVKSDLEEL